MQTTYTMSEELNTELLQFFEIQNPSVFKENLRRLFIDFLEDELRTGMSFYLDDFFYPFNTLLDILEKAGKEIEAFNQQPEQLLPATSKEKVIAFIKACINPEKIFLLHHRIEDAHEHFDLLVIIPSTATNAFSHYEQVISMANFENITIDVSLHKSEIIQQQLSAGHIFYNMVCNEENLVYSNELPAFSHPSGETLQAMAATAEKQFAQAHQKADNFLETASENYGRRQPAMATFMLQQAVELNIRALITALGGHCPKTHCFAELKKPLGRLLPELKYLLSKDAAEENRLLRLLEKAYLEARYSDAFSISDNDFTLITEASEKLHAYVEEIFKRKMTMLKAETV